MLVVLAGFSIASVLIYQAFRSWEESPVKTTVESRPIEEINFPKITVCPPKNTFTNLNYDLATIDENRMFHEDISEMDMIEALDIMQGEDMKPFINNMSLIKEDNMYWNWYHGFSEIKTVVFPFFYKDDGQIKFQVKTSATSGSVKTKYFGTEYSNGKVVPIDLNFFFKDKSVSICNSFNGFGSQGCTQKLVIKVERNAVYDVYSENDYLKLSSNNNGEINELNYTIYFEPEDFNGIQYSINIPNDELNILDLKLTPGFKMTWHTEPRVNSGVLIQRDGSKNENILRDTFVR